mgnify:CR=1 FL=1
MALVVKDRVKETSTTSGTGTLTLAGAASGFQAFSVIGNGNTTYYAVIDGTNWEVGLGTYTLSGTTLARTTVLASTNSNNAVNFSSDSKDVFVVYPASKSIYGDAEGNVTIKATETGDDKPAVLLLQTGETDIAADDALGKVQFQAPDEAAGTDAILVAAEIAAVSEGDFSSSSNATKLSFKTGASEAATEKMSLSSGGNLTVSGNVIIPNAGNIGSASDTDALAISSAGVVTATQMPITPNPTFRAYRDSSDQSLSHNTATKVELNAETFDIGGYYDHSTNYRYTPLVQGYYQVNGSIQDISNTDVYDIIVMVRKNGSTVSQGRIRYVGATNDDLFTTIVNCSDVIYLDGSSDYIELYAQIASEDASGVKINDLAQATFMSAVLVSRTG